jgi:hypothetical protein
MANFEDYEVESMQFSWLEGSIILETNDARYEITRDEGPV